MLQNGAVYDAYPGLDVGLTRINLPDGGSIEPVTSASKSKDGGKETFVVADEVHLCGPLPSSTGSTPPSPATSRSESIADGWLMVTSHHVRPRRGLGGRVHPRCGEGSQDASGLLWDHREAPADLDITDDDQLRAGLEYVYGAAASWTNIDGIIARVPRSDEDRVGQPPLLAEPAGQARRPPLRSPPAQGPGSSGPASRADGTTIVMGFDGSENRDSTALIGWTVAETPHRFTVGLWERPKGVGYEDWHIPRGEVDAAVYRAFRTSTSAHGLRPGLLAVPSSTGWDREFGDDVVVKTNTRDTRIMVEAVQRYTVALAEGRFTHDGDPDVQRHIDNMAPRDTRAGIVPDQGHSHEKIDAGMATLLGFWGLSQVPPPRPKSRFISLADVLQQADGP